MLFSKEHEVYLVLPEEGTFAEEARKAGIEPFILSFVRLRRFSKIEAVAYLLLEPGNRMDPILFLVEENPNQSRSFFRSH